jgi:hypothetical protein
MPLPWKGDAFGGFNNWILFLPKQGLQGYLLGIKNAYLNKPACISISDQQKQLIEEILQESIIPLVKAHRETTFHIVIPPYQTTLENRSLWKVISFQACVKILSDFIGQK